MSSLLCCKTHRVLYQKCLDQKIYLVRHEVLEPLQLHSLATSVKVSSKDLQRLLPTGPAAQQSSRCCITKLELSPDFAMTMKIKTFAMASKMPALLAEPKMRHSSAKKRPNHENHCKSKSEWWTAICLYASAQSTLQKEQPIPALLRT